MFYFIALTIIVFSSISTDILLRNLSKNDYEPNICISFFCYLSIYIISSNFFNFLPPLIVFLVVHVTIVLSSLISCKCTNTNYIKTIYSYLKKQVLIMVVSLLLVTFYLIATQYVELNQPLIDDTLGKFINSYVSVGKSIGETKDFYVYLACISRVANLNREYTLGLIPNILSLSSLIFLYLYLNHALTLASNNKDRLGSLLGILISGVIYLTSYSVFKFSYIHLIWLPLVISCLFSLRKGLGNQYIGILLLISLFAFININTATFLFLIGYFILCSVTDISIGKLKFTVFMCMIIWLLNFLTLKVKLFIIFSTLVVEFICSKSCLISKNKKYILAYLLTLLFLLLLSFKYFDYSKIFIINSEYLNLTLLLSDLKTLVLLAILIVIISNSFFKSFTHETDNFIKYASISFIFINCVTFSLFYEKSEISIITFILFSPGLISYICCNFEFASLNKQSVNLFVVCVLLWYITGRLNSNPYYSELNDVESTKYRICNDELQMYNYLLGKIGSFSDANIISQTPYIEGFIPKINNVLEYSDLITCQYCDVERDNIHEISPLSNIFSFREYADNRLYIEMPNYSQLDIYLLDNKINYVIVDTKQIINFDGVYMSLYDMLKQNHSVLVENNSYALFEI